MIWANRMLFLCWEINWYYKKTTLNCTVFLKGILKIFLMLQSNWSFPTNKISIKLWNPFENHLLNRLSGGFSFMRIFRRRGNNREDHSDTIFHCLKPLPSSQVIVIGIWKIIFRHNKDMKKIKAAYLLFIFTFVLALNWNE